MRITPLGISENSPSPKLIEIDNPMPVWKLAGFKDKDELLKFM